MRSTLRAPELGSREARIAELDAKVTRLVPGRELARPTPARVARQRASLSRSLDVITCCECRTCQEAEAISEVTRLRALSK